jgi:hypothetical protein
MRVEVPVHDELLAARRPGGRGEKARRARNRCAAGFRPHYDLLEPRLALSGLTIWGAASTPAVPAASDGNAVEVGVRFTSDVGGTVTGVRFYKGAGNTGTHVGHLWSASGTLLATATFTGETASGWQQVDLATPVAIAANTVYVASYYAPSGHYAGDNGYFASSGVDSGPLHALADGASGGDGVYAYGSGVAFPSSSYRATNYWVDVVLNTDPAYIQTDYDRIPNFGANPTIVSIANGPWSSASTWSLGRVPTTNDVVSVASNTSVTYDTVSTAVLDTIVIQPGGTLQFRTDISTQVIAANYLVLEGGTLQVGTASNPVAPNVTATIMTANQPLNTAVDPEQYGDSLIGLGKVTISGAPKTTFVRLAAEPKAGATTLTLAQPVSGWQPGDELYLPDTRQLDWNQRGTNYVSQVENPTVAAISSDGLTVTLGGPLKYDHLGARDGNGVLSYLPDVADETRNVVVRSQSGANRGQVMFLQRADVDVHYANFLALGRTTIDAPDNTTFDSSGRVTHVGTNESDRVPVQFRHLWGPTTTPADGYQFTFIGNMVDCPMMNQNHLWAIDINDSHYGLVQDNVVDNWSGAGIVTETGSETHNVIAHNFVARINGTGAKSDVGTDGLGYWFRGPDNIVRDNVATDINPTGTYSYGYNVNAQYLGTVQIPAYQGADPSVSGQSVAVDMNGTPLREFSGNQVYGATPNGLSLWWLGTSYRTVKGNAGTVKNFVVWHQFSYGYFGYETNNLTLDGFVVRGDSQVGEGLSRGLWFADYYQKGLVITNADIQGEENGLVMPILADGQTTVQNSYLRNVTDVVEPTIGSVNGAAGLPAKSEMFRNVTFAATAGKPLNAISMVYGGSAMGSYPSFNYVQSNQLFVVNYNNVSGDNFQVFYREQSPSFVVPMTSGATIGSPVSGLTNAQNWSSYGVAIAGAVLPSAATTRAGITGYVLAGSTTFNAHSSAHATAPTFGMAATSSGTTTLAEPAANGAPSSPTSTAAGTTPVTPLETADAIAGPLPLPPQTDPAQTSGDPSSQRTRRRTVLN